MTPFETEMATELSLLLNEFGFKAKMTYGEGVLNPETLRVDPSHPDVDVKAMFFDPTNSSLSGYESNVGSDVPLALKWMFVQSDYPVKTGAKILSDNGSFKVSSVTAIGPNNPIYYKVATEKLR